MLIASDRHTPADLDLWQSLEEADLVHFTALQRSGKIERSLDELMIYCSQQPCYAAFSGGKDSLVVLSLLRELNLLPTPEYVDEVKGSATIGKPGVPVVFFCACPKANPDAIVSVTKAAEHFGVGIDIVPYESPVPGQLSRDATEEIATRNFLRACDATARRLGRRILGLRADESGVRKIRFRRWGLSTEQSCAPLGWWTLQDVYAYAAAKRLPLCSVYGMLGGGRWERKSLRVDALFGANGDQFGRAEWEQEYYGDVLNRLAAAQSVRPSR